MKTFAVILSGSGVYDGSEIHEATLTLLALCKAKVSYKVFAPNIDQMHVINHLTGDVMNESRNVLVESARISRGEISDLKNLRISDFDAIVFPGGFGAAKNLSTFATEGAECKVISDVENIIKEAFASKTPIGAMCISPVILAKVLGRDINLTIGSDPDTVAKINKMGASHQNTSHAEVVVDKESKVATTPCYMLDANIVDIEQGTKNLVSELLKLTE